jgi:hypothetical protein
MSITSDDLNAFHRFAQARLTTDGAESLQELVELWEVDHPAPALHAQNIAAVRAAIRDMEQGDTGQPAANAINELRAELADRQNQ